MFAKCIFKLEILEFLYPDSLNGLLVDEFYDMKDELLLIVKS